MTRAARQSRGADKEGAASTVETVGGGRFFAGVGLSFRVMSRSPGGCPDSAAFVKTAAKVPYVCGNINRTVLKNKTGAAVIEFTYTFVLGWKDEAKPSTAESSLKFVSTFEVSSMRIPYSTRCGGLNENERDVAQQLHEKHESLGSSGIWRLTIEKAGSSSILECVGGPDTQQTGFGELEQVPTWPVDPNGPEVPYAWLDDPGDLEPWLVDPDDIDGLYLRPVDPDHSNEVDLWLYVPDYPQNVYPSPLPPYLR
ncbi:hypothetical protein V496_02682 [Pseudogymnoascus sp. VKM F-4515 (FW-2607)]|nr:hypothetical protein V496_02682 [Pseudogymnoascus sp. VKM F-4515 (FW-2607)]